MGSRNIQSGSVSAIALPVGYPLEEGSVFEERQAAWKVFLPMVPEMPILAVGLSRHVLVGLARSWTIVHAYDIAHPDVDWAIQQAERLDLRSKIVEIESRERLASSYGSIAINADSPTPLPLPLPIIPGGGVLWIGGRSHMPSCRELASAGYMGVRKYAILPPGGFRILLPLNDGRLARAGLGLFVPGNISNRVAVRVGRFLSTLGFQELLGLRQAVVARKQGTLTGSWCMLDWIRQHAGIETADAAVYAGTNQAARMRKLTLQLLAENGEVTGIAKVADTGDAHRAIERETLALRRIANVPELNAVVPKVIAEDGLRGHRIQIQTPIGSGGKRFCRRLTEDHLAFLGMLSQVDQVKMPLEKWPRWPLIWSWAHDGTTYHGNTNPILPLVEKCAATLKGVEIPFHRVHGDFARWNIIIGKKGLFVVDWEQSERAGLPCYDLVYFLARKPNVDRTKDQWAEHVLSDSLVALRNNGNLLETFVRRYSSSAVRSLDHDSIVALARLSACIISGDMHTNFFTEGCRQ